MGWRVQATKLLPDSYRNITSLLSVTMYSRRIEEMVFLARTEYNEARIQCLTWNYYYYHNDYVYDYGVCLVESETAILNIQGKKRFLAYSFATRIVKWYSVKQLLQVHFQQLLI